MVILSTKMFAGGIEPPAGRVCRVALARDPPEADPTAQGQAERAKLPAEAQ